MRVTSKRTAAGGSILSYMVQKNNNTLPATLARMIARDGLPFRVFVTSANLRRELVALFCPGDGYEVSYHTQ